MLYIEDNAVDADLVRRTLARSAPTIALDIVPTMADGLARLSEVGTHELLLTDLSLPDGSGLEVLDQVRARRLPLAVVILTGSGDQEAAVAALKSGADDYLVKRDDYLDRLPRTLQGALARHRHRVERGSRLLRVLQVDHNAFDVDLMRRHLAHHAPHIRVVTVPDGQAALERLPLRSGQPSDFDLVLVDYRLPGMDGLELTKVLREDRGLDLPIVLVTGHGGEEVAANALRLGVDDYLTKHDGWLFEVAATLEKAQQRVELARERATLDRTSRRLSHLLSASPTILYSLRFEQGQPVTEWVSENIERLLGFTPEQASQPGWWVERVHPDDRQSAIAGMAPLLEQGHLTHEYRAIDRHGRTLWIRDELRLSRDAAGQPVEAVGAWIDVSDHHRDQTVRQARNAVLDQLVAGRSLSVILDDIARRLESLDPTQRVSILLLDERQGCLVNGAAPSLPDFYNAVVEGLVPGEGKGSCGTAAWRGQPVIVGDIDTHPFWSAYLDAARLAGLRACWSVPFFDNAGKVLGTFGIYRNEPGEPTRAELELVEEFARITSLAVQKVRAAEALQQAAAFFEATRDGVVITDLTPRIVAINRAYSDITGFSAEEVIGENPGILKSGRHDEAFYQAMWGSLKATGHWQGEVWNRRKCGELFPEWLSISAVPDESGKPRAYVGVFTDITQLRQSEEQLQHLAHHDPLTGLPNRLLAHSRLQHAIERAERHGDQVAVLYVDLDRFKNVNDSLGHPVGDELLTQLAQRLSGRIREEDTFARLGGDEFLLVLESVQTPGQAATVAQALIDTLAEPFRLTSGHELFIGASIGISLYPLDAHNVTELIQHADMAMYLAKQSGRNTLRFHTEALSAAASERLDLETRLRHALVNGEFLLHYQPLIDSHGAVNGVEALVRWQPPGQAMVSPGRFIPIAEEAGLIVSLGEWVLRTACAQSRAWMDAGLPPRVMAVNLSVRQFHAGDLVDTVRRVLADTGLPADRLELELTESMFMDHAEQSIAILRALKELGVRLAIDDFGTGYSSLAYLKRFPIDKLKIDQSFVRGLVDDPNDRQITATIIAMARVFDLEVLAEGVETAQQLDMLRQLGCDFFQGYHFHRPAPADQIERWCETAATPASTTDHSHTTA
ncbi:MAG TPA: EAL domain-containing protein [Burkholderiaceae bacterium]|nr:EAL domain-containing protein [Burkholderiaceae bacterium]